MSEENTIWFEPQAFVIQFHDHDNKELGRLTEGDDGELTFEGKADSSARVFFDSVVRLNSKKLKGLAKAKELLAVAKCPNAHCRDGVIQEGYGDGYEVFECQFCHERKELLA
jgi:hypothetical protein